MSTSHTNPGRGKKATVMDKVDMSLDDIIRLNKKEQKFNKKQGAVNRRPVKKKGRLMQGVKPIQRGVGLPQRGVPKQMNRRTPNFSARRRGQGVVTGLASRRTGALLKRLGTLNRATTGSQGKQVFTARAKPKTLPFIKNPVSTNQYRKQEGLRRTYRQPEPQRSLNPTTVKRPFQLRRSRTLPSLQTQRDARQATFLFRRGLKIQAQVQKPNPPVRTRQWRTSTNNGILTVSIDNPSARTQPEPPTAYTLHPPAVTTVPVKLETEKKVPKGVALQFDINSVGKPQTSMTLNERFRILKDQRTAKAQHTKGSRFVTVG